MEQSFEKQWVKTGAILGLASVGSYLLLNILANIPGLTMPDFLFRLMFFAVGICGVLSIGGLYYLFKKSRKTILLQQAIIMAIIAFAFFTLMVIVQQTTEEFWSSSLSIHSIFNEDELNVIWKSIFTIQLGIDICFDVFYTLAFLFMSILMFRHPRFGKIFSISGILLFSALLILNLYTFPKPPAESGLVDLGPLTGLWALAVNIQALRSVKWMSLDVNA